MSALQVAVFNLKCSELCLERQLFNKSQKWRDHVDITQVDA